MKFSADIWNASPDRQNVIELQAENQRLRARLETLNALSVPAGFPADNMAEEARRPPPLLEYLFDAERDTAPSHHNAAFASTLHLFHMEYLGIRAAAANLPGRKLAIRAEKPLSLEAVGRILERLDSRRIERFVVHGYSDNMDLLVRQIGKASGARFHCVWHGNFGQMAYRDERRAFEQWLRLQQDGLVARAHILKQNSSLFLAKGYTPLLLNLPPKWAGKRAARPFEVEEAVTAFVPSWSDVRKNWHANVLAAAETRAVRKVLHYADCKVLFPVFKPVRRVVYEAANHMEVVASVDIVFNATLIDCHPMVDLEALACGTPSVTAKLFLGGTFDSHAYARLTEVDNPLDVQAIARAASRIAEVPSSELASTMDDYRAMLIGESIRRYSEFLDI